MDKDGVVLGADGMNETLDKLNACFFKKSLDRVGHLGGIGLIEAWSNDQRWLRGNDQDVELILSLSKFREAFGSKSTPDAGKTGSDDDDLL
jgi:hypothetical protein